MKLLTRACMGIIRMYWGIVPNRVKGRCLFKETCSRYVYRAFDENGFQSGVAALKYRYRTCRTPFEILINPNTGEFQLYLCNGDVIPEAEIHSCHLDELRLKLQNIENSNL